MFTKSEIEIKGHGLTLKSLLFSGEEESVKYAVVTLHGFAGHKDSCAIERMAERLIEKEPGSVLLSFDLPGHDTDPEKLSLEMCDRYAMTAAEYMRRRFPDAELILYGTSFGGFLAIRFSLEHPDVFSRYLLRCPAVDMYSALLNRILPDELKGKLIDGETIEVGFDRKVEIDSEFLCSLRSQSIMDRELGKASENTLIIQGTADEILDWQTVRDYAEKNNVAIILTEGADHRFLNGDTLEKTVDDCVNFILKK